jgi:hypothetical protein
MNGFEIPASPIAYLPVIGESAYTCNQLHATITGEQQEPPRPGLGVH